MIERIKRREDTDGCACLECRGVESVVTRRGIGDIFLWALGVLPTRPSVLLVFLALAVGQFVGQLGSLRLELALALGIFAGGPFAYGYTLTLAAGEFVDRRYAPTTAARYALRRFPTVVGTTVLWVLAMMVIAMVGIVVGVFTFVTDSLLLTVAGVLAVVALFGLWVLVSVKFVLAPEAAVVGGYGPIASFRVSWGIVSFRRRTALLLFSLVAMFMTVFFVGELSTATEPYPILGNGTVRLAVFGLSTATTFISSAFSALVLCHLYVQGVLE